MTTQADAPCSGFTDDNLGFYQALLADYQRAWECLYLRAYRTFIPYACQRSAISTDDALDLLQEGLAEFAVKVKNGKYTFQGSAVTAYVFTVCRNRWVTFLKKNRLRKTGSWSETAAEESDLGDASDERPSPFGFRGTDEDDAEELQNDAGESERGTLWEDADVDWEAVGRAFAELTDDCRTMLNCFYVEEKSLGECGARIGLQETSAKVKRFRCAQRMKTLYRQYKTT